MGRNNKNFHKDLHQQAYEKLNSMLAFGESKHKDMEDGSNERKIYSFKTYETYKRCIAKFIHYVQSEHSGCPTLNHARRYVNEFLEREQLQTVTKDGKEVPRLSAWTLHTEAAALRKLYHISPSDEHFYRPPARRREDIHRSRTDAVRDKHFSVTNNKELIDFCKGTGLRREGLSKIRGDCLYDREKIESRIHALEQEEHLTNADKMELTALKNTRYFTHEDRFIRVQEKGGRIRYAAVLKKYENEIVDRITKRGENEHIFEHIHSGCDVHSYRASYATELYREYARDIDKIPYDKVNKGSGKRYQSDVYICRGDEKGRRLDRKSMWLTSLSLGHSRINIIAENYLRGL